jgi:hypothetical protein
MLLIRFAFLEGLVPPEDRVRFLSSFVEAAEKLLASLTADREALAARMPLHGRLTLDHRIAIARAHLTWAHSASSEVAHA